jgi:hypothetical protein
MVEPSGWKAAAGISMVVLVAKIGNNSKTIIAEILHEMAP